MTKKGRKDGKEKMKGREKEGKKKEEMKQDDKGGMGV